ncbi:hypothetical protein E2C01_060897 [Portunus trituberculatus]|uniref:Uncharacterized protein n=1 Tax=Portunus trituberculatus TaxID=210409 RepID=A0A5B7H9Y3_PORTR|nr:hypothetical protein [Portunus trituberculatus]
MVRTTFSYVRLITKLAHPRTVSQAQSIPAPEDTDSRHFIDPCHFTTYCHAASYSADVYDTWVTLFKNMG